MTALPLYFVVATNGVVQQCGRSVEPDSAATTMRDALAKRGAVLIAADQYNAIKAKPPLQAWTLNPDGTTVWSGPPARPFNLPVAQSIACARVDKQAETVRDKFLTAGSGQSMEYQASEAEAQAAASAPDPLSTTAYPFLNAELAAQLAALPPGAPTPSLRGVVNQALEQIAAWQVAGAAIKQLRRTAKLQITAATDQAGIDAAANNIPWPSP